MNLALQTLANGMVLGSIYAIMAFGLAIVYGVMRVINFAHGVLAVLAAYITFQLFQSLGLDPFLSLVITVPLFFVLGWLIYKGLISRLGALAESSSMILTFGLGISIEVLIILCWTTSFKAIAPAYATRTVVLGVVRLSYPRLFALGLSAAVLFLLRSFLKSTRVGKAIRAVVQDREAATYMGVDVEHVSSLTFAIAMATVAVGGVLLGTIYAFYPSVHLDWIGRLFAIVVLGGMGSVTGAFLGAYLVAITESLVSLLFGISWSPLVGFLVIILVLLYRPGGLMGQGALTRG
jgi:branched-chain amino acid transport system permease protein